MITFQADMSAATWTEVLDGNAFLSFDLVVGNDAEVYLTESAADPGDVTGAAITSWPDAWSFSAADMPEGQRIWVRGAVTIRGVRG